jgi:hypothetical protein
MECGAALRLASTQRGDSRSDLGLGVREPCIGKALPILDCKIVAVDISLGTVWRVCLFSVFAFDIASNGYRAAKHLVARFPLAAGQPSRLPCALAGAAPSTCGPSPLLGDAAAALKVSQNLFEAQLQSAICLQPF